MSAKSPIRNSQAWLLALLAGLGLALTVLFVLYILLFINYPPGYDSPYGLNLQSITLFGDLWSYPRLAISPEDFRRGAILTTVGLWLVFLVTVPVAQRLEKGAQRRRSIYFAGGYFLFLNALLALFMPPVLSSDVNHFSLYGRIVVHYNLNPYVVSGAAVPEDPFSLLTAFNPTTSRLGPLWTIISSGLVALGGDSILKTVLLFKVFAAMCNLVAGSVVFLLARRLTGAFGLVSFLLYGWNPLILLETAGSAHLDAAMLALAVLGIFIAVQGSVLLGWLSLQLSVATKLTTALILPLFVVYYLARQQTWRERGRFILETALVAILAWGLLVLPLTLGKASPVRVIFPASPADNLMPNPLWLSLYGRFTTTSQVFDWTRLQSNTLDTFVLTLSLAFLGLLIVVIIMAIKNQYDWPHLIWWWGVLTFLYLFVVHGGSFPWYMIVPFAATSISWPAGRTHFFWGFCVLLSVVSMLIYGVLRTAT
ncbi:MAG: hypothetical protein U9R25_20360 [Chloroflexota bacterium]|nr:hypothetical protein [Chloroflexota bacterium]